MLLLHLLRSEYLFTLHQSVARNIFEIGEEQLRSVKEIGPKSPFLCVNQWWIQTFRQRGKGGGGDPDSEIREGLVSIYIIL